MRTHAGHQQLSVLRQVTAEDQHSQPEHPVREQVDDLEQHPASQPIITASSLLAIAQVSHSIEYSSEDAGSRARFPRVRALL
jgi:hypothetical protein